MPGKKKPSIHDTLLEAKKLYEKGYDIHWITPAIIGDCKSGKKPIGQWSRSERYSWDYLEKSYNAAYNVGFQPGATSIVNGKNLIVLEVDFTEGCEAEARAELKNLIANAPPTVRSGGGGYHYHILVTEEIPTGLVLWKGKDPHSEIRVISTGGNCVLPPSRHWSGGTYQWIGKPIEASESFLAAVRKAAKRLVIIDENALKIGKTIPLRRISRDQKLWDAIRHGESQGNRSETLYYVIATLYKRGEKPEDILATILNGNYGISEKPLEQGVKWARREIARVIAKVEEEKSQARRTIEDQLRELSEKYFVVQSGSSVRIGSFDEDGNLNLLPVGDFHLLHQNKKVLVENRFVNLSKLWLESEDRPSYSKIIFDPTGTPPGQLNLWRGFNVHPSRNGSCELIKDHIKKNICDGDEAKYAWLMNWIAHIFQRPGEKPGTVPVLRGATGVGKTFLAEVLCHLVGPFHSISTSRRDHLAGRFNVHLANKLLVIGEELSWGGNIDVNAFLRDFATTNVISVEPKGSSLFMVRSFHRLMVIANSTWVVQALENERRYVVFDVGTAHQKDLKYFAAISAELNNGGYERFLYELLEWPIDEAAIHMPFDSSGLREQQIESLPPVDRWWYDCLTRGELLRGQGWPDKVDRNQLVGLFKAAFPRHSEYETVRSITMKIARRIYPEKWSKVRGLTRVLGTSRFGSQHRSVLYRLPELEFCRRAFARSMGWSEFE